MPLVELCVQPCGRFHMRMWVTAVRCAEQSVGSPSPLLCYWARPVYGFRRLMQSCKSVPSRSQVCRGGGEGRHRGARTCTEGWRVRLQVGSVLRAYTLRTRVSTGYLQCTFDWLHLGPEPEAHTSSQPHFTRLLSSRPHIGLGCSTVGGTHFYKRIFFLLSSVTQGHQN